MRSTILVPVLALSTALSACNNGPSYAPILPVDYLSTYTQVRECRSSSDHDLDNVTIWADPLATQPYMGRVDPFPTGCVVVKAQYDPNDTTCSGPVVQWTVMEKLLEGSSFRTNDWRWQRMLPQRKVVLQDDVTCINCHADCGGPPYGYLQTCSAPAGPTGN